MINILSKQQLIHFSDVLSVENASKMAQCVDIQLHDQSANELHEIKLMLQENRFQVFFITLQNPQYSPSMLQFLLELYNNETDSFPFLPPNQINTQSNKPNQSQNQHSKKQIDKNQKHEIIKLLRDWLNEDISFDEFMQIVQLSAFSDRQLQFSFQVFQFWQATQEVLDSTLALLKEGFKQFDELTQTDSQAQSHNINLQVNTQDEYELLNNELQPISIQEEEKMKDELQTHMQNAKTLMQQKKQCENYLQTTNTESLAQLFLLQQFQQFPAAILQRLAFKWRGDLQFHEKEFHFLQKVFGSVNLEEEFGRKDAEELVGMWERGWRCEDLDEEEVQEVKMQFGL